MLTVETIIQRWCDKLNVINADGRRTPQRMRKLRTHYKKGIEKMINLLMLRDNPTRDEIDLIMDFMYDCIQRSEKLGFDRHLDRDGMMAFYQGNEFLESINTIARNRKRESRHRGG